MAWQTPLTAPMDGEMLGWSAEHGYSLVQCDNILERNNRVEYFNGDVYCIVTHWMPLPPPPAAEG